MAQWAVFDIDGTLLPGVSIEKRFLSHFRRERRIPYRSMLIYVFQGIVNRLQGNKEDAFKSNKMYLKGIPSASLVEFAERFFKKQIIPLLSKQGLETIESYQRQGYKIMLMSGSLDILVGHITEICDPDHLVCTELELNNRRFTGRIVGIHPYGLRKKQILEKLKQELEIDFNRSVVYANHHTDVHHMKLFKEAVAVNPTEELQKIALQLGWKIERWV